VKARNDGPPHIFSSGLRLLAIFNHHRLLRASLTHGQYFIATKACIGCLIEKAATFNLSGHKNFLKTITGASSIVMGSNPNR